MCHATAHGTVDEKKAAEATPASFKVPELKHKGDVAAPSAGQDSKGQPELPKLKHVADPEKAKEKVVSAATSSDSHAPKLQHIAASAEKKEESGKAEAMFTPKLKGVAKPADFDAKQPNIEVKKVEEPKPAYELPKRAANPTTPAKP